MSDSVQESVLTTEDRMEALRNMGTAASCLKQALFLQQIVALSDAQFERLVVDAKNLLAKEVVEGAKKQGKAASRRTQQLISCEIIEMARKLRKHRQWKRGSSSIA